MATLRIPTFERMLESLKLKPPIPPIPHFNFADVLHRPLDLFRSYLAEILRNLVHIEPLAAYNSIQLSNDRFYGEFTVVLPRLLPGTKAKDVPSLAENIIRRFPENPLFDLPWSDGIHLRIVTLPTALPQILIPYILDRGEKYGKGSAGHFSTPSVSNPMEAVVVFSSPDIVKEFQGKYLWITIIGEFVSNMYENMGWKVRRINYLGDWGKDIALLGLGLEKFGDEEGCEKDPMSYLLKVYHKINEQFQSERLSRIEARDKGRKYGQKNNTTTTWTGAAAEIEGEGLLTELEVFFKRMEDGDEQAVASCKRIRDVNVDNLKKLHGRLGITLNEYLGESQVSQEIITEIEQTLRDKNLVEESGYGDSVIIDMKKHGLMKAGKELVRDRTGSSYFLRYLAAVVESSRNQNFDKIICVAAGGNQHFSHLQRVIGALGMAGLAEKLLHVALNEENVFIGEEYQPIGVLDQCAKSMADVLNTREDIARVIGSSEDVATRIGTNALLLERLSTRRQTGYALNISNITSFKSGTGLDLQYQYIKLCALLNEHPIQKELCCEGNEMLTDEQIGLLFMLGQYPEITRTAYDFLESSHVVTYLHSVLEKLDVCLNNEDDEEMEASPASAREQEGDGGKEAPNITPAEVALYESTRIVIENGMNLLGLLPITPTQQKMVKTPISAGPIQSSEGLPGCDEQPIEGGRNALLAGVEVQDSNASIYKVSPWNFLRWLFEVIFWPRVPHGHKRIVTPCTCGEILYADFHDSVYESSKELMEPWGFSLSSGKPTKLYSTQDSFGVSSSASTQNRPSRETGWSQPGAGPERSFDTSVDIRKPQQSSYSTNLAAKFLYLVIQDSRFTHTLREIVVKGSESDGELFLKIRRTYLEARRTRLRKPSAAIFVKLRIEDLPYVSPIAGTLLSPSIPPPDEVKAGHYTYIPCPIESPPPMTSNWFLHHLNFSKDQMSRHQCCKWGPRLPKKLGKSLTQSISLSEGWGIQIEEGPNWGLLAAIMVVLLLISGAVTGLYVGITKDSQTGVALGTWLTTIQGMALAALFFWGN